MPDIILEGQYWNFKENPEHHTSGKFTKFMNQRKELLKKYFGVDLFPGSLNVHFEAMVGSRDELDKKNPSLPL
jgi:aspartate aminotransferase-like enzyme